jgi:hypothetical protein
MITKNGSHFIAVIAKAFLITATAAALQSCGGGGESSSSGANLSRIFVGDGLTTSIGTAINANPAVGVAGIDRLIAGPNTGLVPAMSGFALDAGNDRLYVANGSTIRVFNNAGTASGNVSPARVISTGPVGSAGLAIFSGLFLDTANDLLYVPDVLSHTVRMYRQASTANGEAPHTSLSSFDLVQGVAVDVARDIAYVLDSKSLPVVQAISNAKSGGGGTRTIVLPVFSRFGCGILVDSASDTLYVSSDNGNIDIFNNASTQPGTGAPTKQIKLPDAVATKLALDTGNNRLYALGRNALYIIDNASAAIEIVPAKKVTITNATSMTAIAVRP